MPRRFNKKLTIEIDNLFARISKGEFSAADCRLDDAPVEAPLGPEVDIQKILEKIRNLDVESK